MEKTKARKIAEEMEEKRVSPGKRGARLLKEAKVDDDMPMVKRAVQGIMGPAASVAGAGADAVRGMMGTRPRDEEEMSELTREVGRGMKKGGKVKKYASGGKVTRGDGIASKGHTKGKMV